MFKGITNLAQKFNDAVSGWKEQRALERKREVVVQLIEDTARCGNEEAALILFKSGDYWSSDLDYGQESRLVDSALKLNSWSLMEGIAESLGLDLATYEVCTDLEASVNELRTRVEPLLTAAIRADASAVAEGVEALPGVDLSRCGRIIASRAVAVPVGDGACSTTIQLPTITLDSPEDQPSALALEHRMYGLSHRLKLRAQAENKADRPQSPASPS